jgi:hypothetical protein
VFQITATAARPLTVADLHRDLRAEHPDFRRPAVSFINSSVARYVEVAWRWYCRRGSIAAQAGAAGRRTPDAEYLSYLTESKEHHEQFLAELAVIDPAIADPGLDSLCISTLLDD